MALSRNCCFGAAGSRAQAPSPSIASKNSFQRALDIAARDFVGRRRDPGARGEGPGVAAGIQRGIELAAGLGQHQPAQQIRPLLRRRETQIWPPRECPSGRPASASSFSMKPITSAMCWRSDSRRRRRPNAPGKKCRKETEITRRCLRQRSRTPPTRCGNPRACHARRPAAAPADLEIGHVISVDGKGLHGSFWESQATERWPIIP